MTSGVGPRTWRRRSRRQEAGYAAVITALLASVLFLGMAAMGVDTARWYVEVERVQKAADAAALAGVTFMPNDFTNAKATAIAAATKNGFPNSGSTQVVVTVGSKPSELKVTIKSRIHNTFGAMIGVDNATIVRSAVADYTAPAPMGSPCNTFANEPPSQPAPAPQPAGSALPTGSMPDGTPLPFNNCSTQPSYWAAIQGPNTDKEQGDRYMDNVCDGGANAGSTFECSGGKNSEFREDGYYWAVHVEPQAVGSTISVQVYDAAFMFTQIDCRSAYQPSSLTNNMNDFTTTDGATRYARVGGTGGIAAARIYCAGDYNPGGLDDATTNTTDHPPTTTFVLRHQNATFNPRQAVPIAGCNKQFKGLSSPPTVAQLTKGTTSTSAYDYQMSQLFHQWVEICSFVPDAPGDYYLQVRTDVGLGGATAVANPKPGGGTRTSLIYKDNPNAVKLDGGADRTMVGTGLNSFAIRAVPSDSSKRPYIAVAGNESMPILQNKDGSTAVFNLIRALPGTRGQYIAFDFYDGGDGAQNGATATVKIKPPSDSSGSVKSGPGGTPPNCKHAKNNTAFTAAASCTVTIRNETHDGQLEHVVIPIPNDYNCNPATLGGCWFSVEITFPGTVTDFTTWTANIGGDPVRLIE
jgi:Flp pilus assembly protein TadG